MARSRIGSGGILCCGNIGLDTVVRPVEQFHWGTTTWVESISQHLGGNGSNTAYTLGMLGVHARLLGMVGRDAFAERILAILQSAAVDLEWVGRSGAPTTTTVALVNPEGNRMFLHQVGSSVEVYPEPIEFTGELLRGVSHFHLANVFALPNMRASAPESMRRARKAGLTTSLDTGWDARGRWLADLEGCLPYVDLMFMNQDEALQGADFVYVKNWSTYTDYGKIYCNNPEWMLTNEKLKLTKNAKIMHCLPVRRNVELSDEILDGPNSLVTEEASNRVWAAQAVLSQILNG